jgi:hypothetical protein
MEKTGFVVRIVATDGVTTDALADVLGFTLSTILSLLSKSDFYLILSSAYLM